ncbi:transcription factor Adf-1-like [Corticium candelabrum]|uniref:transcription factor Adf-1-like n=1 Tax=Corticium candelabrum TaxID=121492 RepID=UPI002E252DCE|nr:transcription factor Adf-1-like [Corticium candelabrum]
MDVEIDCKALIEAVRNFPCLWKKVSESVGSTEEICAKKWQSLLDKYVQDLKKVNSIQSGDEEPPITSSWPYFILLSFLEISVRHKTTCSSFPASQTDDREEEVEETKSNPIEVLDILNSPTSPATHSQSPLASSPFSDSSGSSKVFNPTDVTSSRKQTRKRKVQEQVDEALLDFVHQLKPKRSQPEEESDEVGLFGMQIAANLRRLQPHQKGMAKIRILQVLSDVELGTSQVQDESPSSYSST